MSQSKPFDTVLNSVVGVSLTDWAAYLAGKIAVPLTGAVREDDTDISDQAFSDKVFVIDGPTPYLIHLEFESSSHLKVPARLHEYNSRLTHGSGKPVYSVLMLLRPRAAASDQTGHLVLPGVINDPIHTFRYTVVRVWEESVETFLNAGPAFLPLALLTNEADRDFANAFERFRDRLSRPDIPRILAKDMVGYAYTMCGLRYSPSQIRRFFMGIRNIMEDSETYQELLQECTAKAEAKAEAKVEAAVEAAVLVHEKARSRTLLLKQGGKKFGPADAGTEAAVNAIDDLDRLDRLAVALLDVTTWAELLAVE
jgi:hypothetical protein